MVSHKQIAVKTKLFPDLVYWLTLAITAANYSFFTFPYGGGDMISTPFKPLAYLRLPLAVAGYFYLLVIHRKSSNDPVVSVLVGIFCATAIIAIPFAPTVLDAFNYGIWLIFQLLFLFKYADYLVSAGGYPHAKSRLIVPLIFFGAYFVLLSFLGLPNWTIGKPVPPIYSDRAPAAMIMIFFLGGVAVMAREIKAKKILSLVVLAGVLFCLFLIAVSGKRASMLCAIIIAAGYFVYMTKVSGKFIALLLIPAVVLVALQFGAAEFGQEATEYSRMRIERGQDERTRTSIQGRFDIWERVEGVYIKYPLGAGVNSGRKIVGGGLHNTYLGYLLENGWIGILVFMTLLTLAGFRGFFGNVPERRQVLIMILLPAMLYAFTEYNSSPGQPTFVPLWVGICFCLLKIKKRKRVRMNSGKEMNKTARERASPA